MSTLRRQYRFTITPEHLIYDHHVSDRGFRLWCVLDRAAGDTEVTMPTRQVLAELLGTSVDTIDRGTQELIDSGWLEKQATAGRPNTYILKIADERTPSTGGRRSAAPPPRGAATVRPPVRIPPSHAGEPERTPLAAVTGGAGSTRQDLVFEAVAEVCGIEWRGGALTASARGPLTRAVKELKQVGAEPDEIRARSKRYLLKYPGAALTPMALAKHWSALTAPTPVAAGQQWYDAWQ